MMRTFDQFVEHLSEAKRFTPRTVIDVGVAWGTPLLYRCFPDAYLVLVEALPYFANELQAILKNRSGEAHLKAVSDAPGVNTVRVQDDTMRLAGANVIDRTGSGDLEYQISIERLDALIDWAALEGPILLKLDVQGADLRALKGAGDALRCCDVVIVEASIHNPRNRADDIIAYMSAQGFRLYDVFGASYRPYDNALGQVDLAFAPCDSSLFAYQGWA